MGTAISKLNAVSDDRLIKSISIGGFLLIFVLALQARFSSASVGYELSMYSVYPAFFWIYAIFTFAFISISIVYLSFYRNQTPSLLLFFALVLAITIIISLPLIRNYYLLGRGDVLTHVGHIRYILRNHRIPPLDIYPSTHLLSSFISQIIGISPNRVAITVSIVMYLLFSTAVFSLARRISSSSVQQALIIVMITIPIYGQNTVWFVPHTVGFFYFPTALLTAMIVADHNQKSASLLFLVAGASGILFHPMDGLWLLITSFLLIKKQRFSRIGLESVRSSGISLLLAIWVAYTMWYYSKPGVQGLVVRELKFLLQGSGSADVTTYTGFLGQLPITYLLRVVFWRYGMLAIITGSAFIAVLFAYIFAHRRNIPSILAVFLVISSAFTIITPLSEFIVISDINRLGKFNLFFGAIIIGLSFGKIICTTNRHKELFTIFCVFLIVVSTIGTMTIYGGPLIKQPGQQVTRSEIDGHQWIFEYGSLETAGIAGFGLFPARYYYAIYGKRNAKLTQNFEETSPPPHFGYNGNASIDAVYESGEYLFISEITEKYYKGLFPNQENYWRYKPEDVVKLSSDYSTERIYTNGGSTIYVVST